MIGLFLDFSLPDDEQEISVFDYYLDESGEWDTWQSRLPDITYVGNTDIMGEVFIETQDTVSNYIECL